MKRYEIQKDDLEIEQDSIIDTETNVLYECCSSDMNRLCELLNKQDDKWQKLKEFIVEQINFDKEEIEENKEIPNLPNRHYLTIENIILEKMQELEGEDER